MYIYMREESEAETPCRGSNWSQARHQHQHPHPWRGNNTPRFCVSSLRRGQEHILCIVPILTDAPRRESEQYTPLLHKTSRNQTNKHQRRGLSGNGSLDKAQTIMYRGKPQARRDQATASQKHTHAATPKSASQAPSQDICPGFAPESAELGIQSGATDVKPQVYASTNHTRIDATDALPFYCSTGTPFVPATDCRLRRPGSGAWMIIIISIIMMININTIKLCVCVYMCI